MIKKLMFLSFATATGLFFPLFILIIENGRDDEEKKREGATLYPSTLLEIINHLNPITAHFSFPVHISL